MLDFLETMAEPRYLAPQIFFFFYITSIFKYYDPKIRFNPLKNKY